MSRVFLYRKKQPAFTALYRLYNDRYVPDKIMRVGVAFFLVGAVMLAGWREEAEQSRAGQAPPGAAPERVCQDYSGLFKKIRSGIAHIGMSSIDSDPEKIGVDKWLGTGFLVDSKCTFITAKHILRNIDRERIAVRFQLPPEFSKVRTLKADLIYQDEKQDLAMVRISKLGGKRLKSGKLHVFPLYAGDDKRRLAGQAVLIVGHPVLADKNLDIPVMRAGLVSSTDITWGSRPMLLLDLQGVPGFSGSPVILARSGEVVGVVFGPGPTVRAFGFEWATPVSQDFYDAAATIMSNEDD